MVGVIMEKNVYAAINAVNDYVDKSKDDKLVEGKKYKKEEKNVTKQLDISDRLGRLVDYLGKLKEYIATMKRNREAYKEKYGEKSTLLPVLESYENNANATLDDFVTKNVQGYFSSWKSLKSVLTKIKKKVDTEVSKLTTAYKKWKEAKANNKTLKELQDLKDNITNPAAAMGVELGAIGVEFPQFDKDSNKDKRENMEKECYIKKTEEILKAIEQQLENINIESAQKLSKKMKN